MRSDEPPKCDGMSDMMCLMHMPTIFKKTHYILYLLKYQIAPSQLDYH